MGRAPCCDKANVKKGPWSPEEDARLKAYIEEHGTGGNWIALPQKIGLKRCGKSCRLRWLNYLRPNIKHGDFSEEEEHIICSLYISIGSRWSIIAAQLPGRTDNDIKNYWNTKLKKKLLGKRAPSRRAPVNHQVFLKADVVGTSSSSGSDVASQTLSASAMERIQLHMRLQGLYNNFLYSSNSSTAPWPKLDTLPQDAKQLSSSQPTDAVATTVVQRLQFPEQAIPAVGAEAMSADTANYVQETVECSKLGFLSANVESSGSNLSYTGFGLHDELYDDFIYGKNGLAVAQEGIPMPELQCSGDPEADARSPWMPCDYGSTLQANSILQDFVLGYEL